MQKAFLLIAVSSAVVCLYNSTASATYVAAMGTAEVNTVDAGHFATRDVAREVVADGTTALAVMAEHFIDRIRARISTTVPLPEPMIGIFGGYSDGVPMVVGAKVDSKVSSSLMIPTTLWPVFAFSHQDVTGQIAGGSDFGAAATNSSISAAGRLPKMMEVLITGIIDRNLSDQMGGTPTILVMPKGENPYWDRKAGSCPPI